MGLRFDPIGGGQFKNAVKELIEIEKKPIKALEARKAQEQARVKLFAEFKTKFQDFDKVLSEFTNFRKFRELKADLGNGKEQMSVTIDKEKADVGSWVVEVDQLASRSSIISNHFEDPEDTALGIGFINLNLGNGESTDVYVDGDHASLRGVASLINQEIKSPVRASVIKDDANPDAPWRLIITAKNDGLNQGVDFPELYFLDGDMDFFIADNHEADNALYKVDSFDIEHSGNHIVDFLSGVNVDLKSAKPDETFTLTITEDYEKIAGKVKSLVDKINGVLKFINDQNKIDEKSDTRNTFGGDTSLQTVEYRIRNMLHQAYPVGDVEEDEYTDHYITELGIEFDKAGGLVFKEDKFTKEMQKNFEVVGEIISGEYGLANSLRKTVEGYTRSLTGMLTVRDNAFRDRIRAIDDQIESKTRQVDQKAEALTSRFARLQATLGGLQQQQQYMQSTLGGGGGGNIVSQLLG